VRSPQEAQQAKAIEKILGGEDEDLADLTLREIQSQKERYGSLVRELEQS